MKADGEQENVSPMSTGGEDGREMCEEQSPVREEVGA